MATKLSAFFQVLFLAVLTASISLFIYHGLARLPWTLILPIPLLVFPPYWFTYRAAIHKTHLITESNHEQRLRDYPYDHVLFRPNRICTTCDLRKPARSKHCSLCGHCVAKSDHHCPWVNNCVGRGNHHFFLGLLLSLGVLELYGAYLAWYILRPYLITNSAAPLFSQEYLIEFANRAVIAVNAGGLSIAGVGLLAASTALLPLVLLAYHIYLIWAGMTTNESSKWADWREDMADGLVYKAEREALLRHQNQRQRGDEAANGKVLKGLAYDLGLMDVERCVDWPTNSDQIVVRTNNGKPPQGQEALWEQVWYLGHVENQYDLGAWGNWMEVLRGR